MSINIDDDTMEKVAERLRGLRQAEGWTQDELAQRSKLERKTIIRYENAQAVPTGKALLNLTRIFGVSADYLLGITDKSVVIYNDHLSELERQLIQMFRNADDDSLRQMMLHTLKELAED